MCAKVCVHDIDIESSERAASLHACRNTRLRRLPAASAYTLIAPLASVRVAIVPPHSPSPRQARGLMCPRLKARGTPARQHVPARCAVMVEEPDQEPARAVSRPPKRTAHPSTRPEVPDLDARRQEVTRAKRAGLPHSSTDSRRAAPIRVARQLRATGRKELEEATCESARKRLGQRASEAREREVGG